MTSWSFWLLSPARLITAGEFVLSSTEVWRSPAVAVFSLASVCMVSNSSSGLVKHVRFCSRISS